MDVKLYYKIEIIKFGRCKNVRCIFGIKYKNVQPIVPQDEF